MSLATRSLFLFLFLCTGLLTLAGCAGDTVEFKTPPVPRGLALLEAGLDPQTQSPRPDNINLLEETTAWVVARDAITASVFYAFVNMDEVGDDFDPASLAYTPLDLVAAGDPDELFWVRYEADIPSRAVDELLAYYFELQDDTGARLLSPEEGSAAAVTVQPVPFQIDFEWPNWPQLYEPLDCIADLERVFDGGPNQGTLVPGPAFKPIKNPIWVHADDQQVATANLMNVRTGVGVEWEGQYYFLPLAVMLWNEVANHGMGDRQLATSYCPLTDTALLFDTGFNPASLPPKPYFAPAGLYNSNLSVGREGLLDGAGTAYNQMMGYGLTGPDAGDCLVAMPSVMTSFAYWKGLHPDTYVLEGDPALAAEFNYLSRPNPYDFYWRSGEIDFPVAFQEPQGQERLFAKSRVMGVMGAGDPLALPLERQTSWVHHDRVQNTPIVVFYQSGTAFCLESRLPDTGLELRFVRAGISWRGNRLYRDDQPEPSLWTPEGVAISGPLRGKRLAWVPSMSAFWFAWYTMYPETRLVEAPGN